jgi:hypothetical protein
MNWMIAGLLSAAAAFCVNRLIFRVYYDAALFAHVPLVEEVAKTMVAHFLGANILYTHLVFGLIEALLDWRGEAKGMSAAASAMIAHGVFGFLTVAVIGLTGVLGVAIVVSFLAHALWNAVMLLRLSKR